MERMEDQMRKDVKIRCLFSGVFIHDVIAGEDLEDGQQTNPGRTP